MSLSIFRTSSVKNAISPLPGFETIASPVAAPIVSKSKALTIGKRIKVVGRDSASSYSNRSKHVDSSGTSCGTKLKISSLKNTLNVVNQPKLETKANSSSSGEFRFIITNKKPVLRIEPIMTTNPQFKFKITDKKQVLRIEKRQSFRFKISTTVKPAIKSINKGFDDGESFRFRINPGSSKIKRVSKPGEFRFLISKKRAYKVQRVVDF